MRTAALLALASALLWGAAETTPPNKPKPVPGKKAKTRSPGRRKTAPKGRKTAKTAAKRGKRSSSTSASTWRSRQLAPTPDRYKEIQSALAQRGYLKKSPSGVWDAESTDALRRFQQDQSLEATGKLNSLSLMALGLGPKHSAPTPAGAAPHAPAPQNPVLAPQTPQSPVPDSPNPAPSGPAAPSTQF